MYWTLVVVVAVVAVVFVVRVLRKNALKHSLDNHSPTVVVAGASSGIGHAIARDVCKRWKNPQIHLIARREEQLLKLASVCRSQGATVWTHVCDISQEEKVADVGKSIASLSKGIDLLFVAAGVGMDFGFEEVNHRNVNAIFSVNTFGAAWIVRSLLPMLRVASGRVSLISSSSSVLPRKRRSLYGASKAALESMFDHVRIEELKNGVSFTNCRVGFVSGTEMSTGVSRIGADCKPEGGVVKVASKTFGLPFLTPEQCAEQTVDATMCRCRLVYVPRYFGVIAIIRALFPSFYDRMSQ